MQELVISYWSFKLGRWNKDCKDGLCVTDHGLVHHNKLSKHPKRRYLKTAMILNGTAAHLF